MDDQKKPFVVAIKKIVCHYIYWFLYACSFSDEGTKGDCYIEFCNTGFRSIPGHRTLISIYLFGCFHRGLDTVTNLF
jgi:hypothetical protein